MSAPRTIRLEWDRLERIEDRLWFLAEVLKQTAGLKPHHCQGLSALLGDLAADVHELLRDEEDDLAAPGGHFH